jgi:hypothetical protein
LGKDSVAESRVRNNLRLRLTLVNKVFRKIVLQNLLVAESLSVEIVSVHLTGVSVSLSGDLDVLNSAGLKLGLLSDVQVPDRRHVILEISVTLNLRIDDCVVLHKVAESNASLRIELMVGTVECGEKIEKFKSDFVNSLDALNHIGVASRLKAVLKLSKVKRFTSIQIHMDESLLNSLLSNLRKLFIKISKERLVVNLALSVKIVNSEDHVQIARLNI